MRGRPKAELVLSEAEHEQLTALTLRRKTSQALALRARIVLACASGIDNKVVAGRQRVTPQTVSKWRARFVEQRLDGERPHVEVVRHLDIDRVEHRVVREGRGAAAGHLGRRQSCRQCGADGRRP